MNSKSLRRIEEVIKPSGRWTLIEINGDVVYLDFEDVELGNVKVGDDLSISFRFAESSFVALFYDNIWDIDFAAKYDAEFPQIFKLFSHKVKEIKFIDFEHLNSIFEKDKYGKSKILSMDEDFDINNIRNDYFVSIETDDLAVVVGGNEMNFFTKDEKINDDILKELSNRWMLYCLQYHLKRNIINKDSMCEKHEY